MSRGMSRIGVLATVMALATFGLGACGGGGTSGGSGGSGGSDEDQITGVVERYIADDTASVCKEIFTTQLLEEVTGETGDDAVKACEQNYEEASSDPSGDIKVSGVEINGGSASADVSYTNDGEDFNEHVTLVKEDGDWKIDSTKST